MQLYTSRKTNSANRRSLARMLACTTGLVVIAAAGGAPAHAQDGIVDTRWTGSQSDRWETSANWTNGLPDDPTVASVDVGDDRAPVIDTGVVGLANAIFVGEVGDGLLTIQGGGLMRTRFGRIGEFEGSNGRVVVTGAGSRFAYIENDLVVGNAGTGEMLVDDGALAEGRLTQIGAAGMGIGLVTISGAGSRLTTTQLQTGISGTGTLRIENGGLAETEANFVGSDAGGVGRVFVDGIGSRWRSTMQTNIGVSGDGAATLSNGATATGAQTALGLEAGGVGTLTVQDAGSLFEATAVRIGDAGTGNLNVLEGGRFTSPTLDVGFAAGSTGSILIADNGELVIELVQLGVSGSGSLSVQSGGLFEALTLQVGNADGGDGSVEVLGGGRVSIVGESATRDENSAIGNVAGSSGSLFISGAGSELIGTGFLEIGKRGNGSARIENGGLLQVRALGVGEFNGANGSVIVDGSGSTLRVTGLTIYIGTSNLRIREAGGITEPEGGSGSVTVQNGGIFDASVGLISIGAFDPLSSGSLTVTGAGTLLHFQNLVASRSGTLRIEAGAVASNPGGVGTLFTRSGSQVIISDPGTLYDGLSQATINGRLTVENGARFNSSRLAIGEVCRFAILCNAADNLTDPLVRIEGAGSLIRLSGSAFVNTADTFIGTLEIANGAMLAIGAADGEAAGAAGSLFAARATLSNGGTILLNHTSSDYDLRVPIGGSGSLLVRSGTTLLGATHGFSGPTTITGGALIVNGIISRSPVSVSDGGMLGGSGRINQSVDVGDGTIAPGNLGIGTLTLGSLHLSADSRLDFELGAPGSANDLVSVNGSLVLDGTLNVTNAGGFGAGVYRLFDYTAALTDNGLAIGLVPSGFSATDLAVQNSVANQVNLLVHAPTGIFSFWDGDNLAGNNAVDGGDGTWSATATNWTLSDGSANGVFAPDALLIFQGSPGTVTIAPGGVTASGLQFAVDGYRVEGDSLTLNGPATLRVGDGSAAGAGYTVTIANVIAGGSGLSKTDLGTLVLTGPNTYTGGTSIGGGVLQVSSDTALGEASGGVTLDGGTLRLGGAVTSARAIVVGASGGTLDTGGNALTLSGALSGSGLLVKPGDGTLSYSGDGAGYSGTFTLAGGALALTGTLGGTLRVAPDATLSGTGTLNDLDVAGTLAPGDSIGTLDLLGDVVFRAGSTFEVEVAANGDTDLLTAVGTATIEGGTVAINALDPDTAYTSGTHYTFLTGADGLSGAFDAVTTSSAFLGFALGYDATSAFTTVEVLRQFPDVAQTFNQGQAAGGLMGLGQTPGSDSLAVYNEILMLGEADARAVFDAASGEIYASLIGGSAAEGARRADRLVTRGHESMAEGWGLWGGATGRRGSVEGDGNAAEVDHHGYGFDIGIDYRGTGNAWALGAAVGYVNGGLDADARGSSSRYDGWHVGAYGRYGTGNAGLTATAAIDHGESHARVTRRIAFGTIARTATADVDVDTFALAGELRYGRAVGGGWAVGPVASLRYGKGNLGTLGETGAASLNLSSSGASDGATRLGGGLFANWQDLRGSFDISAQYVDGSSNFAEVPLAMAAAPNQPFKVRSPRNSGGAALLSLAGRHDLGGGWSIGGEGRALFGKDERDISGSLVIGWRF